VHRRQRDTRMCGERIARRAKLAFSERPRARLKEPMCRQRQTQTLLAARAGLGARVDGSNAQRAGPTSKAHVCQRQWADTPRAMWADGGGRRCSPNRSSRARLPPVRHVRTGGWRGDHTVSVNSANGYGQQCAVRLCSSRTASSRVSRGGGQSAARRRVASKSGARAVAKGWSRDEAKPGSAGGFCTRQRPTKRCAAEQSRLQVRLKRGDAGARHR
jgi:hypothetical protein